MTVQEFRAFNRFYTNVIGALDYSRHLYAPYTLTEARVLYELAGASALDAADLRTELSLDAGYLSRILGKFEQDGLIERAPSDRDPRRRMVVLTSRGRGAADLVQERADESAGSLLSRIAPEDRIRLDEAMRTIRAVLTADRGADGHTRREDIVLRRPRPGDLGWIVQRNAAVYAAEYGWNAEYESLVARIVADFAEGHDPDLERVWMADLDGRPVGCVMCVRDPDTPGAARLRLLLVEPEARGLGLGDRLVEAVIGFARDRGYRELVLWTNDVLAAARRVYRRHGFVLASEKPHHSFGKDLIGQDWCLDLRPAHKEGDARKVTRSRRGDTRRGR